MGYNKNQIHELNEHFFKFETLVHYYIEFKCVKCGADVWLQNPLRTSVFDKVGNIKNIMNHYSFDDLVLETMSNKNSNSYKSLEFIWGYSCTDAMVSQILI